LTSVPPYLYVDAMTQGKKDAGVVAEGLFARKPATAVGMSLQTKFADPALDVHGPVGHHRP
jgi:hypothetical protein